MIKVCLGSKYFDDRRSIMNWCKQNIGIGGMRNTPALMCKDRQKWLWTINFIDTNTELTFKTQRQMRDFVAVWGV